MPRITDQDNTELGQLLTYLKTKIHMSSPLPFYVTLGAVVGTHLNTNQPVWLMHVGPPGSGKSLHVALIARILKLDGTPLSEELGNPTGVAALLTSRRKSEDKKSKSPNYAPGHTHPTEKKSRDSKDSHATGGLLNKLGSFGIIRSKDFTSILEKQPDARAEIVAALREVYDGEYSRPAGGEGGESLTWGPGHIGFIGGVTNVIDTYHTIISKLGDRWLYWRWPQSTPAQRQAVMRAMTNEDDFIRPLAERVNEYVHSLNLHPRMTVDPGLTEFDIDRLYEMSVFLCHCRINVPRDTYNKKDFSMPQIESETRSCAGFYNIYTGMVWAGVPKADAWKTLYRLMVDSIPVVRSRIITLLLTLPQDLRYPAEIARRVPCGSPTATYALEDLMMAGIVEPVAAQQRTKEHLWKLTAKSMHVLDRISNFISAAETEYENIQIDME